MPTIIQTFVRRTTELKMSMRAFNSLYNLSVHGDATNLSTAQKNTAKSWIVSPSSSMLASVGTTTFTQCRITESTTKLNTLGGGDAPLGYPMVSLERGAKILFSHCNHPQPIPIRPQETENTRSHVVSCQDVEAPGLVQGVISIMETQEHNLEDFLFHGFQMM